MTDHQQSTQASHALWCAIAICILGAGLPAAAFAADDLHDKYARTYVGQARSDIITVLGPPTLENETSVLGMSYATMRWRETRGGPAVTVRLVGGRLVASQYCERATDC